MSGDTFEESLVAQGLSSDAIRVAVAMMSAISSARTIDEAVAEFCAHEHGSVKHDAARIKWRELLFERIANASTVSEIRTICFCHTQEGTLAWKAAIRKWIDIASTPEEIREVYWETEDLSEEQNIARDKLIAYFENLVNEYKTAHA